MEPEQKIQYQQPQVQPESVVRPEVKYEVSRASRTQRIISIIIALLAISGLVWYVLIRKDSFKEFNPTPIQTLESLKNASLPVTKTPEQQVQEVDTLSKNSKPVEAKGDARLQELDLLN